MSTAPPPPRRASAPPASVSTHRPASGGTPGLAALWELAGLWLLILLAGVLLIAFLLLNIRAREEQGIQQARLSLTLTGLQEAIEGDLALGLDLPDQQGIQPKLERALSIDSHLHAIDVVDRAGIALFSTDRGAIGEPSHPTITQAAEAGGQEDRAWSTLVGSQAVMGIPLHNAFGEVVGHVNISYAAPVPAMQWVGTQLLQDKIANPIVLTTCALLAALLVTGWAAARWVLTSHYRRLAEERGNGGRLARALAQSAAVRMRMDDCLARLDESERLE